MLEPSKPNYPDAILMFFSIKCFFYFHSHLLRYLILIHHDEKSNLYILSSKSLCKD